VLDLQDRHREGSALAKTTLLPQKGSRELPAGDILSEVAQDGEEQEVQHRDLHHLHPQDNNPYRKALHRTHHGNQDGEAISLGE